MHVLTLPWRGAISVVLATTLVACATGTPVPATEAPNEPTAGSEATAEGADLSTPTAVVEPTAAEPVAGYVDPPSLAEQVAAGDLPPAAERLPVNPLVVDSLDGPGAHGGEWVVGMEGNDDTALLTKSIMYDGLVRFNTDGTGVVPNLAVSWSIEEDGRRFVFTLREGVKWSDGTPFTSADILFWAEDVRLNPDIHGDFPSTFQVSDQDPVVTAPDPLTVVFEWPVPNGLFLERLARPPGTEATHYQAAYAKQFHPAYNEDGLQALIDEAGAEDWLDLWDQRVQFEASGLSARNQNIDLPTLNAWVFTSPLGQEQRTTLTRNPYYWKVDSAGQQLPYFDTIAIDHFASRDVLALRALNGELTAQDRRVGQPSDRSVFIDSAEQNGFRIMDVTDTNMNERVVLLNLNHQNEAINALFNTKLFRQAMSVAINRDEMIALFALGLSQPWQAAPRPDSVFADEEFGTQFTEYDSEQAEAWLDELGLTRGADGNRTLPNGDPLELVLLVESSADVAEELAKYWNAVGLDISVSAVERSLFRDRVAALDFDIAMWAGASGTGVDIYVDPRFYFPFSPESYQAVGWAAWFNEPEAEIAIEPPDAVRRQMDLYNQMTETTDLAEREDLMRQILTIAKEEFFVIGLWLPLPRFGIVRDEVRGVPEAMLDNFSFPQPGVWAPETFWIQQ